LRSNNQGVVIERGGYDYDGYVWRIFDNTNKFVDTVSDEPQTPHLFIPTNEQGQWGRWNKKAL